MIEVEVEDVGLIRRQRRRFNGATSMIEVEGVMGPEEVDLFRQMLQRGHLDDRGGG